MALFWFSGNSNSASADRRPSSAQADAAANASASRRAAASRRTIGGRRRLLDGASGRAGSAVYGDEARTRMAPGASSRGWAGRRSISEAAQPDAATAVEELEDPGVVLVLIGTRTRPRTSTSVFCFLALSRRNVTGSERFGVAARGGVSMASISMASTDASRGRPTCAPRSARGSGLVELSAAAARRSSTRLRASETAAGEAPVGALPGLGRTGYRRDSSPANGAVVVELLVVLLFRRRTSH